MQILRSHRIATLEDFVMADGRMLRRDVEGMAHGTARDDALQAIDQLHHHMVHAMCMPAHASGDQLLRDIYREGPYGDNSEGLNQEDPYPQQRQAQTGEEEEKWQCKGEQLQQQYQQQEGQEQWQVDDVGRRQWKHATISTGCSSIDSLLGGGLPLAAVTEVTGAAGAGKTQFCLQAAAVAAISPLLSQATDIAPPQHASASHSNLELTPVLRLGAGATAGIIAMSATYPMDMVRGRLTVQSGRKGEQRYKGMRHAAVTIVKEEGVRALYKGWLPSVIGVIPYVGLNFAVYETLKDWLARMYATQQPEQAELSVLTKLACGAVAGTLGQTVAYPLDVVRRRLQMVGWKDAASVLRADGTVAAAPQYTGMIDAFRKTVQTEGVKALYKGLVPNSVKVVPSIAIAFVTYEIMRDLLKVEIRISD
ncbi:hypothetical protein CLOP_g8042 [Closterium sp. NIES-67]|nr:hypothetical protein CLOP_g8042 [Closterium sp. NIES-67]